jgi:acetyl/propionyl-CoA carboxylase alpha subunit/acetyl-CoA carboxylase carboxyltransferase component
MELDAVVDAASRAGCDALHPGYGFLSESAELARRCAAAGVCFVGPRPEVLELLGDKARCRRLAKDCGVPVVAGTEGPTGREQARAFLESLGESGAIMLKAVSGGGGRGMRVVDCAEDLDEAFERSESEALAAFGRSDLYVERLVRPARHIEVQIAGDGTGDVSHLWERDCTLQRRHQKLIEIAPAPSLAGRLRQRMLDAAALIAGGLSYRGLATFEFLVEADAVSEDDADYVFMEANPRLQVEHTITEELTGIDLVRTQILLAAGHTLAGLGIAAAGDPPSRGFAMQLRVNMETLDRVGNVLPGSGTIEVLEPPSGPGIRVDGFGYAGYRTSVAYDSLLAKVIVHVPAGGYEDLLRRARRALREFRIEGVQTNLPLLTALLDHPDVVADRVHTRFVEECTAELVATPQTPASAAPGDVEALGALVGGIVIDIQVRPGDEVVAGQPIAVVEAMKMEHVVVAETGGVVREVAATVGQPVEANDPLIFLEPGEGDRDGGVIEPPDEVDLDAIRADLAAVRARRSLSRDEGRPDAVARRNAIRHRTARANIDDLVDPGSFREYGAFVLAAQRERHSHDELVARSPADGLIAGLASINGDLFDESRSRAMVMSYDWTVFAGTQGVMGHKKAERMFALAHELALPVVLFAEGGGGRPGDSRLGAAGFDMMTFLRFARLSALAPTVGIASRFCFAGNAALLGCCDVIIATKDSNIGMGGPAMIEGGGLGVVDGTEIGPAKVQAANGVIDVLVEDEAEAVATAKRYLAYFQGVVGEWGSADQRLLRRAIPDNRARAYDVREVCALLADNGSVLELRPTFGVGTITALVRVEGRPLGLIASNPLHLGGAIDAAAADKAARFMQLCDAYGLPILSLVDTPGFMVGPEAEADAQVRHASRLFVTAANLGVPMFVIVLRKGYGLGAQAAAGGSFHAPTFVVSWPTGEFGGMGLEGFVRLAYRRELEAIEDSRERRAVYDRLLADRYEAGKALTMAEHFELDDVIDPADSRAWIVQGLKSLPRGDRPAVVKRRSYIDAW